ncbi:MAG: hypothetical protein M0R30_07050 [Methanoregula sp.]|uniref:hypothetical protein n=1 Tax=Methanoregula sp. TaxID=2052170 RepID=UPI0025F85032|nr:hypothetical protein [Methanoregula sp.]MCK9631385.1 hypothetical protein [Methanoregula sp.]
MMIKNYKCIVFLLLACFIFAMIPVSALQSTEQSLSDSLTRGSRFTITITGSPNTAYYVWLPGTFTMTGEQYDQPPVIAGGQADIEKDPEGGPYTIGSYQYNNGGGRTILDDVAPASADMSNTNYYAQVTTDEKGQAIVEFRTSVYTAIRSYSVKVENPQAPEKDNFLVEQKTYSRSASKPMINTPATTITTIPPQPTFTPSPTPTPTLPPEALPVVTAVPTTTPVPTKKAPMGAGIAVIATGICLIVLSGKRRFRQ